MEVLAGEHVLFACEMHEVTWAFGWRCVGDKGPDAGAAQATIHPWFATAANW
jgi:hypothetical protein